MIHAREACRERLFDRQTCSDEVDGLERDLCLQMGHMSLPDRIKQWSVWALYSLCLGLTFFYLVRVTGWVAAGFRKPASV